VRASLRAWGAALERDVARAAAGIEAATEPADDEHVAASSGRSGGAEGLEYLSGETLFARRVVEARHAHDALIETLGALADALAVDARIEIPQHVYKDVDSGKLTLERPSARAAAPPMYLIELVPKENPAQTRQMYSQFKLPVGLVLIHG
jgi:hypothetical protein